MFDIKEYIKKYNVNNPSLTACESICAEISKKYIELYDTERYITKVKRLVELCIIIHMLPLQADRENEFKILKEED